MQKWAESFIDRITPALFTLAMPVILAASTHIFFISQVMPLLVIISIYYWCMFHPGSLPYSFLFALGLLQDTLSGAPLGFSSLINIVFAWVVINRFHIMGGMSFITIWLRFMALCAFIIALEWLIMSVYDARALPVELPLLKLCSTCLAYPVIHALFTRMYRRMHG